MAFSQSTATESRAWGMGPVRVEIIPFSMLTSDTSGTITAKRLDSISDYIISSTGSASLTAATISGTTLTLTFADAAAACAGYSAQTVNGYVMLIGH